MSYRIKHHAFIDRFLVHTTMSRTQIVNELHKPVRKNFSRLHVKIKGIDDLWQADLVEMIQYAKDNDNFKYLLTVIDTFSKFAWAVPIKTKTSQAVTAAFSEIFAQSKRIPRNLQTDMGTEFYNKYFKQLMKQNNINHYSTFSVLKASIVERFNRTIKEKMWKMFSLQGSYKWVKILKKLMIQYNTSKHRTIKLPPIEVTKENEKQILKHAYTYPKLIRKNRYQVGDFVRISKFKTVFEKGYTPNWTTEIFKVIAINNKFPVTYLLEDYTGQQISGRFYEKELQKTNHPDTYLVEKILKKEGSRVYVKWLGFDSSHNSWINKNDML